MASGDQKPEIYIECVLKGALLQVRAIDSVTGTEAMVFGPQNAREVLTRNAVAKLAYVMKKRAENA